jgi:NAD(P)-dependent dehydrogenase (short-subunit alcohol dehydrogenase family)
VSAYVLTGGTDAFAVELAGHLRAPVQREPAGPATSWVHLLPGDGATDETAALVRACDAADEHLPHGEGAGFVAVVPVWGAVAPPHDAQIELAAAAARALATVRVERWSREGRRINVIAYGGLDTVSLPGLRPAAELIARTPAHRLASVAELANAVDFVSSAAASYVTGSVLPVDGGWTAYSWFHPARDM